LAAGRACAKLLFFLENVLREETLIVMIFMMAHNPLLVAIMNNHDDHENLRSPNLSSPAAAARR
jgi:hypothetical protein